MAFRGFRKLAGCEPPRVLCKQPTTVLLVGNARLLAYNANHSGITNVDLTRVDSVVNDCDAECLRFLTNLPPSGHALMRVHEETRVHLECESAREYVCDQLWKAMLEAVDARVAENMPLL